MQEEFEKQDQPMRILVCAGSKSEIDEILSRLTIEEKRLGKKSLSIFYNIDKLT